MVSVNNSNADSNIEYQFDIVPVNIRSTNESGTNMRRAPNADAEVVGKLYPVWTLAYRYVDQIEEGSGYVWQHYRIEGSDQEVWIALQYVEEAPVEDQAEVNNNEWLNQFREKLLQAAEALDETNSRLFEAAQSLRAIANGTSTD